MDTIRTGITGDKTLATINQIITQQENRNSSFLDSHIDYENGVVLNKVTFELYDDDTVPKQLTLKKKTDPAPANATNVWEGIMAIENNLQAVICYRNK
jgi:hypothetical protein